MGAEDEREALVSRLRVLERAGRTGTRVVHRLIGFAQELREAGLVADPASVVEFARAMLAVGVTNREAVRSSGAVIFARSREQVLRYEVLFEQFWGVDAPAEPGEHAPANASDRDEPEPSHGEERPRPESVSGEGQAEAADAARAAEPSDDDDAQETDASATDVSWSRVEVLRHRSFEAMTPEETREAGRMIDRLRPSLALRRTRRVRLHDRGDSLAPRAMLRRSLSTGGDLLYWRWRRPLVRIRPVIILCDVSGSMERYSRLLLRFSHALLTSDVPVEAFVFGTRLTRVSRELRRRNPDAALAAAAATVADWSGGTDIGQALKTFNRDWGKRLPLGRAIVLVISDGWDRGSAETVAAETARLRRSCHRLIWLNPLAGSPGYEPLTAGMAAALPHVDRFLAADSIADLEHLATLLAEDGLRSWVPPLSRPPTVKPSTRAALG